MNTFQNLNSFFLNLNIFKCEKIKRNKREKSKIKEKGKEKKITKKEIENEVHRELGQPDQCIGIP
jgi:hypothetical protein